MLIILIICGLGLFVGFCIFIAVLIGSDQEKAKKQAKEILKNSQIPNDGKLEIY
jgi:hypothetical protein